MAPVRQNYSDACEAAINKQINMELYASYVYQSMKMKKINQAYYFDRGDVALKGCFDFFKKQSDEERMHAEMFMRYQNLRGGRIVLQDIKAPSVEWDTHIKALDDSFNLEKKVNEAILELHKTASSNNDPHLCDFLENNFVNEQVESINEFQKFIVNAKRCGDNLGVYEFVRTGLKGEE